MRRIVVLRNPTSGRGSSARRWPQIERRLQEIGEIVDTCSAEDLRNKAQRFVREGYDIVAAAGGDGTIHGVTQALVGTSTALAVIPMGTGNDFARTLGIGTDLDAAVAAIETGRTMRIDVGRWRQGEREGYFINVAGCGFDAAVANRINRGIRGLTGRVAYLAAIGLTLRSFRPLRLRITIDEEYFEADAVLCAIANAQSYGAGLKVAPMADLRDGLLDLALVGDLGRVEFLRNLPGVTQGLHVAHPKVMHRALRRLRIESDPPSPFLIDGELLPPSGVGIEALPAALSCVVP